MARKALCVRALGGLLAAASLAMGGCIVVSVHKRGENEVVSGYTYEARPRIGVTPAPVGEALAAQLGVERSRATLVADVSRGAPADEAGVRRYDVITQIDGSDDASPESLRRAVRSKGPGEELRLRVVRQGEPMELVVRMEG